MKKQRLTVRDFCLQGTWKSDKERTVANLPKDLSDSKRAFLADLFGKLRLTYTDTACTSEFEGEISTCTYQVVARDRNSVVIERDLSQDPQKDLLQLSSITKMQFIDQDHYWIVTDFGGFKEYFTRIDATSSR